MMQKITKPKTKKEILEMDILCFGTANACLKKHGTTNTKMETFLFQSQGVFLTYFLN